MESSQAFFICKVSGLDGSSQLTSLLICSSFWNEDRNSDLIGCCENQGDNGSECILWAVRCSPEGVVKLPKGRYWEMMEPQRSYHMRAAPLRSWWLSITILLISVKWWLTSHLRSNELPLSNLGLSHHEGQFCVSAGLQCPGRWSRIILDVSVRIYLHEMNI